MKNRKRLVKGTYEERNCRCDVDLVEGILPRRVQTPACGSYRLFWKDGVHLFYSRRYALLNFLASVGRFFLFINAVLFFWCTLIHSLKIVNSSRLIEMVPLRLKLFWSKWSRQNKRQNTIGHYVKATETVGIKWHCSVKWCSMKKPEEKMRFVDWHKRIGTANAVAVLI